MDHTRTRRQMASTFGTLLSSQGTDAHPSRSSDPSGGNFSTLSARACGVKPRGTGPSHERHSIGCSSLGGFAARGPTSRAVRSSPPCEVLRYVRLQRPGKPSTGVLRHAEPAGDATTRSRLARTISKGPPQGRPLRGTGVRRRPTLPHSLPCSTIGAEGLSFRVRNGTGRFPFAMTAVTLSSSPRQ